jgi:hypothetical protein
MSYVRWFEQRLIGKWTFGITSRTRNTCLHVSPSISLSLIRSSSCDRNSSNHCKNLCFHLPAVQWKWEPSVWQGGHRVWSWHTWLHEPRQGSFPQSGPITCWLVCLVTLKTLLNLSVCSDNPAIHGNTFQGRPIQSWFNSGSWTHPTHRPHVSFWVHREVYKSGGPSLIQPGGQNVQAWVPHSATGISLSLFCYFGLN